MNLESRNLGVAAAGNNSGGKPMAEWTVARGKARARH